MDLTFAVLETKVTRHRILKGWIDAVFPDRAEVRGHLTIATRERITIMSGVKLVTPSRTFLVTFLRNAPPEIPDTQRLRFLASYDPDLGVPQLAPNPSITRTQEFFLSPGLESQIEALEAAPTPSGSGDPEDGGSW